MTWTNRRISRSQVFCALAALITLAGCHRGGGSGDEEEKKGPAAPVLVEVAVAAVRPVEELLTVQGTLAAAQGASARVAALAPGRLVDVRVREGDRVAAGQLIAIIDNRAQQAQTRSAAAAASASASQALEADIAAKAAATDQANAVRLARLSLDSARLDRDSSVRAAQSALLAADTDLARTRAGSRPQEVAQAEQAVRQAQATRDRASQEVDRQQLLFEKGIAARRQLEDAKTALSVAEASLESARQQISLLRAGPRPEDLHAAEIRVQQAREALDAAKSTGDAKVRQAEAALRQASQTALTVQAKREDARAQRQLAQQKRADLEAARAASAYAEVHAPMAGVVTRRALNPGDSADTNTPIVEIAETRRLELVAATPADDAQHVRPGMPARVTSDSAPGVLFGARVISVGQVDPQSNLASVRLQVDNASGRLRTGAFGEAAIVVRGSHAAVVVPRAAVLTRNGSSVVYVAEADGIAKQHDVIVGAPTGDLLEVRSGLKAGDQVITTGQYELSDGAKIKLSAEKEAGEKTGGDKAGEKGKAD